MHTFDSCDRVLIIPGIHRDGSRCGHDSYGHVDLLMCLNICYLSGAVSISASVDRPCAHSQFILAEPRNADEYCLGHQYSITDCRHNPHRGSLKITDDVLFRQ